MCGNAAAPIPLKTGKTPLTYYRCGQCGYTSLAWRDLPGASAEKSRYLLHRNDSSNSGYLDFLSSFLDAALLPYVKPGGRVLDFGSGPSPLLAGMLAERGYRCDIYDRIFARTRRWKTRIYDAILLHEVAEHLRDPQASFSGLIPRVAPGGIVAIRTRFLPDSAEEFSDWWYRMDKTHMSFFTASGLAAYFESRGFFTLIRKNQDIIVFKEGLG